MVLGDPPHCPPSASGQPGLRIVETPELQCVTYSFAEFTMTCDSGTATNTMRKSNQDERYGTKCRIGRPTTNASRFTGRNNSYSAAMAGWQVIETDGKLVAEDKGVHPDSGISLTSSSASAPGNANADIEQAHQSACLVHLANTSIGWVSDNSFRRRHRTVHPQRRRQLFLKPPYRGNYRVPEVV
jgi:hypothetical protein